MDAGLARALFLLCVVFYAAWRWHARICERHSQHHAEISGEHVAAVFRRKRLCRLGVLAFCLLALGSYYLGLPRLAAVVLLGCAGLCQYGVWRERTIRFFPQEASSLDAGIPGSDTARPTAAEAEGAEKRSGTTLPVRNLMCSTSILWSENKPAALDRTGVFARRETEPRTTKGDCL